MHPAVAPLATILRLNTELLLNCLDRLDEQAAQHRGTGDTNNVAFLATHLVDSRHFMAEVLGAPRPSPFAPAIARARCLDDAPELPPLTDLTACWEAISAHLAVQVERLDTAQLARESRALPGSNGTVLGNLAFLVQHESYHLGQVALLRRQLGFPAMSYALRPREPGRLGA